MEYLIIGAGPAGLQLGYHLRRAGRDYQILEAGPAPGHFFKTYPRHRKLISINKPHTGSTDPEHNLRMDWNSLLSDDPELLFTRYSPRYFPPADVLVQYLADYAEKLGLNVAYDTRIAHITRAGEDGDFIATDEQGRKWQAQRLIIATGVSKPYIPPIPGIETIEQYADVSVDPEDFTDQRVLIIGKANSAFETADNLMETAAVIHVAGPSPIQFAWKTHFVGHLRAVNNNLLDSYQLKSQNALLDGEIVNIAKDDQGYTVTVSFSRVNEVLKDLRYDRVIGCTGFRFDADIFDPAIRPRLVIKERFPEQTPAWESTNVPGLYFAGTLTQMRDFKKSTSGFIHGFRYGVRALSRVLEERYHGAEWPHAVLEPEADVLMEAVIARVNRSSALWQQFGFLGDVIRILPDGSARYCEEMPMDHVREGALAGGALHFTITLEYGPDHDKVDPFDLNVTRIAQNDPERAAQGQYLHPVVRAWKDGALIATHHVTENLENDWTFPHHREPLQAFFKRMLEPAEMPA